MGVLSPIDEVLAGTIGRVSLAGEDELHGELLVVHNLGQTVEVGKEKVCALVCGEAACETDDESVGVDAVEDVDHSSGVSLIGKPFLLEVAAEEIDEFVLHRHAQIPDCLVGDIENTLP